MSTSTLPPTAPTTLVIVLGASNWPNSPSFQASEAFVHAAQGFKEYLLDPQGLDLSTANLLDLFDVALGASDQLARLSSFLEERIQAHAVAGQAVRDVLVYFVGHGGFVGSSHDFYLLPQQANTSILRASGIGIDALADVLREKARQTRRYLFLDCCFAAAAFRFFQGGPDQTAIAKTQEAFAVRARSTKSSGYPRKGTVLLCSSDQKSPSLLLPDESCTMFSYALLDVLKNGDLHRPLQLSLRDIQELAQDRLAALPERTSPRPGLYSPDQSEGDVATVPFFPNRRAEEEQARSIEKERIRKANEEELRRVEEERRKQTKEDEQARIAGEERVRDILTLPARRRGLWRFMLISLTGFVIIALISGTLWFTYSHVTPPPVSASSRNIMEFAIPTAKSKIGAIIAGPDGNLWFTEQDAAKIGRITPSGNITEFATLTANSEPIDIIVGPDGNLWFTEYDASKIGRITPSGNITEFATLTPGSQPLSIITGPDGNLWFTEFNANKIGRIIPSGSLTEFALPITSAESGAGLGLGDIIAGPDGNLWFNEFFTNKVGRITTKGSVTEFATASGPRAMITGPDGNLWFAELTVNKIGRITPTGSLTEFALPINSGGEGGGLGTIVVGPDGNLWFTEDSAAPKHPNEIGRITPSGSITAFALPITPTVSRGGLGTIVVGPDRNLWFTEYDAYKIGRITPSGSLTEFATPTANSGPSHIIVGPDGNLWFNEFFTSKVGRITLSK